VDAELRHAVLTLALACACDAGDGPELRDAEVPDVEACAGVLAWPQSEEEDALQGAIEGARARGVACGALGRAAPSDALQTSGALTCAARVHALDMSEQDYFEHEDPDGRLPWHRIADAGFSTVLATELIAHGETDPVALVENVWLPSDPHCGALAAESWTHVGLARWATGEPPLDDDTPAPTWWVVVLAVPDAS
jgi:hypothetical protein